MSKSAGVWVLQAWTQSRPRHKHLADPAVDKVTIRLSSPLGQATRTVSWSPALSRAPCAHSLTGVLPSTPPAAQAAADRKPQAGNCELSGRSLRFSSHPRDPHLALREAQEAVKGAAKRGTDWPREFLAAAADSPFAAGVHGHGRPEAGPA